MAKAGKATDGKLKHKRVLIKVRGLKDALAPRIKAAEDAVDLGKKAVKASKAATVKDPTNAKAWRALIRNQRTLAKATTALKGLNSSRDVADDLCPFQIMITEYRYDFL